MAVIKEFICKAHGSFESFEPHCPHGCKGSSVERQFLTAPGYPQKMNGIDRTLDQLAKDHGLTDMKHNSLGSIKGNMHGMDQGINKQVDLSPRWGSNSVTALQAEGHQLGDSGLKTVQHSMIKPEQQIPYNIKAESAKDLKI